MPNTPSSWFHFLLKKGSSITQALEELSSYQVEEISFIENKEEDSTTFYGKGYSQNFPPTWQFFQSPVPTLFEVNWQEQWELFCPYFKEGFCKIPLHIFKKDSKEEVLLHPGPGFGDLSHPTTHLMMELLGKYANNSTLIDLGCGSGILGLTALKLGAEKVYCLDIEIDAIKHTKENAILNHLEKKLFAGKTLPKILDPTPNILCINMTFEEQKQAISCLPKIPDMLWLTSGILESQRKKYLAFAKSLNLTVKASYVKDKWLSFILI